MTDGAQSYVKLDAQNRAITFAGPDAISLASAIILRAALNMYVASGGTLIPTRGVTITVMLKRATQITHKPYKRGQAPVAAVDLTTWIEAMKAAIPIIQDKGAES